MMGLITRRQRRCLVAEPLQLLGRLPPGPRGPARAGAAPPPPREQRRGRAAASEPAPRGPSPRSERGCGERGRARQGGAAARRPPSEWPRGGRLASRSTLSSLTQALRFLHAVFLGAIASLWIRQFLAKNACLLAGKHSVSSVNSNPDHGVSTFLCSIVIDILCSRWRSTNIGSSVSFQWSFERQQDGGH